MKKPILIVSTAFFFIVVGCGKKAESKTNEITPDTSKKETVKEEGEMKGTLTLSKPEVEVGEELKVTYKTEGPIGTNAWVGLIPSNVEHGSESKNDENDISYQYLNDKTGTMTFIAPADTGKFDFRLNSTDNNGKELASVTFWVKGPINTKAEISVDKKSYAKGEKIMVSFRALVSWDNNAWIGLIPAGTKHGSADEADKVDLGYKYLEKRGKATFEFTAPSESGKYSFRMFDSENGKEVKSVDFLVE